LNTTRRVKNEMKSISKPQTSCAQLAENVKKFPPHRAHTNKTPHAPRTHITCALNKGTVAPALYFSLRQTISEWFSFPKWLVHDDTHHHWL
jgi:hypothetical protein